MSRFRIIVSVVLAFSAFLLLPSILQAGPVVPSCVPSGACDGNTGHVGQGACNGDSSCVDNSGDVAKNGCHGDFACFAFADPSRVIAEDLSHSSIEQRYVCFGWVEGGVVTVRFTHRADVIRIFGAGYWRKAKTIYERENSVHRRTARPPEDRS